MSETTRTVVAVAPDVTGPRVPVRAPCESCGAERWPDDPILCIVCGEPVLGEDWTLYHEELVPTEDAAEGLRAFVEKRPPVWKNR